jgi:hypothetical protein
VRPFKGIFYNDISEFESDHLSQAVVSYQLTFELLQSSALELAVAQTSGNTPFDSERFRSAPRTGRLSPWQAKIE